MNDLHSIIAACMDEFAVPGVAVALIKGGSVVHHRQYGTTRTTGTPLDAHTLFQAASLSKPVFAYAVLALVEHRLLDLDTPLSSLAPDAAIEGEARHITARHVLTHTTGFPNWREDDTTETLIVQASPGTRFGYSGEGFEYLQCVVEHIAGQSLGALVAAQVFAPLGMQHSRWDWARDTNGEDVVDDDGIALAPQHHSISSAAWSLLTTAEDYARFLQAILEPRLNTPGYLSPATIEAMLTPAVQVGTHDDLAWGLGWGLQRTAAGPAFYHWGGPQNGYTAYTCALQQQGRAIVILTNSENGLRACRTIAEHALGVAQPAFGWLLPEDRWTPTG